MPAGRPTKCTPEVIRDFAEYMGAGLYFEDACDLVGVTSRTGYNWLEWGEEALTGAENDLDAVPEEKQPYAQFFHTVRARAAAAIARNLAIMQQAAQDRPKVLIDEKTGKELERGDWRAAAKFLEMRKPDTWGMRKQSTELSGPAGGPVEVSWLEAVAAECAEGAEDGETD